MVRPTEQTFRRSLRDASTDRRISRRARRANLLSLPSTDKKIVLRFYPGDFSRSR